MMRIPKLYILTVVFLIAVIGWLIHILDHEINGPQVLSNNTSHRACDLAEAFGSAVVRFKQDNNGVNPQRTRDLYPKYIPHYANLFPSWIHHRIAGENSSLGANPDLLDVFGVWTLFSTTNQNVLVVLNPRFFGNRNVAIYRWENGQGRSEVVSLDDLINELATHAN